MVWVEVIFTQGSYFGRTRQKSWWDRPLPKRFALAFSPTQMLHAPSLGWSESTGCGFGACSVVPVRSRRCWTCVRVNVKNRFPRSFFRSLFHIQNFSKYTISPKCCYSLLSRDHLHDVVFCRVQAMMVLERRKSVKMAIALAEEARLERIAEEVRGKPSACFAFVIRDDDRWRIPIFL